MPCTGECQRVLKVYVSVWASLPPAAHLASLMGCVRCGLCTAADCGRLYVRSPLAPPMRTLARAMTGRPFQSLYIT